MKKIFALGVLGIATNCWQEAAPVYRQEVVGPKPDIKIGILANGPGLGQVPFRKDEPIKQQVVIRTR